jgi:hypothetical protein
MMVCRSSESCRNCFLNSEISPLPSQYILSLLSFMIRNRNQFLVNSEIYHSDTNLLLPRPSHTNHHSTHPTLATTTSRSTGRWKNTPRCHHLNIPHNTNRQSPEPSENQILWFRAIPRLVITGILTTTFNQDFNNRHRYHMSPTPKCSDWCLIS